MPLIASRKVRILLLIACMFVFILGGYAIFAVSADRKLQYVIDQYRARGEPIFPEDFKPTTAPADSNAATHLRAAIEQISLDPEDLKLLYSSTRLPLTAAEIQMIRRVIEPNGKVFDEIHLARQCAGVDWGITIQEALSGRQYTEFQKLYSLAWIMRSSALIEHDTGSDALAVERLRGLLGIGGASRRIAPTLIAFYIGTGIDESAIETIVEIAPDLRIGTGPRDASADDVRQMIETLRDESSIRESFATGWRGERVFLVKAARESPYPIVIGPLAKIDMARLLEVLENNRKAGLAANYPAALPFMAQGRVQRNKFRFLPQEYSSGTYEQGPKAMFRFLLERRMATVALAMTLYRADHGGAMPESLDVLVPTYLPALPADPYRADGRSFSYVRTADWPVLYSWGENGRDDNASTHPSKVQLPLIGWSADDAVMQLRRLPRPEPEKPEGEP